MAKERKERAEVTHEQLRDATISGNREFVEESLRSGYYELLFVEFLEQEWRIYLISQSDSKCKEDLPFLLKEAINLRQKLKYGVGENKFRKLYDFFWNDCSYSTEGNRVPKFDDNESPLG